MEDAGVKCYNKQAKNRFEERMSQSSKENVTNSESKWIHQTNVFMKEITYTR